MAFISDDELWRLLLKTYAFVRPNSPLRTADVNAAMEYALETNRAPRISSRTAIDWIVDEH